MIPRSQSELKPIKHCRVMQGSGETKIHKATFRQTREITYSAVEEEEGCKLLWELRTK